MRGSTCFGRFLAHHQELITALAASALPLDRGDSSVVGRGLPDNDQRRCYRHDPKVKPEAANAVISS